jgi:serine/threonine protein kinase
MTKRKATTPATGAGRRSKRSKTTTTTTITEAFVWKTREWKQKTVFANDVSLLVKISDQSQKVIKKVLPVDPNDDDDLPREIQAIAAIPSCNRIVTPIHYIFNEPDADHGTAFYEHYALGDLRQWKEAQFDAKNNKPMPESFIWRFLLQISQALALLQNKIGPDHGQREVLLHRDIKPRNVLVVDIGTTYPSFKLHDFGIGKIYRKSDAGRRDPCGTFDWQPPEIPIINTKAADIWALGACVHYLATGLAPTEDINAYAAEVRANNNDQDPDSVQDFSGPDYYYAAHVPRQVTAINLSQEQQRRRGIGPYLMNGRYTYNHQYSDELNEWMKLCLRTAPGQRPTAERLINNMIPKAKEMLKKMGGKAALVDLDVVYEDA